MNFALLFIVLASGAAAQSPSPSGRWDGTIVMNDLKLPFSMELDLKPDGVSGAFVNGDEKLTSTSGSFKDGILQLTFEQHGTTLEASIVNGRLNGTYGGGRLGKYALEGGPYCTCAVVGEPGPDISGTWTLGASAAASLTSGRLIVRRRGSDTVVHVLSPTDTNGELTGLFDGLAFMLHHFDGARAALLELEPRPDGALNVTLREPGSPAKKFHAVRTAAP